MLVYYFVPFIVGNRYLLFWVSNAHNSITVQNRTHVYMNFFGHKDLGNHLLQLCPKVVKHPVYDNYDIFGSLSSGLCNHLILEVLITFLEDLAAFIFREEVAHSEEGSSKFLWNIGVVGVCDLFGWTVLFQGWFKGGKFALVCVLILFVLQQCKEYTWTWLNLLL